MSAGKGLDMLGMRQGFQSGHGAGAVRILGKCNVQYFPFRCEIAAFFVILFTIFDI